MLSNSPYLLILLKLHINSHSILIPKVGLQELEVLQIREVQWHTPTRHPYRTGRVAPSAGKKLSFLVRKCYRFYWKVWLATFVVKHSINALLPQGSTKCRLQSRSFKSGRGWAGRILSFFFISHSWLLQAPPHLQLVFMVAPGLLWRPHDHVHVLQQY